MSSIRWSELSGRHKTLLTNYIDFWTTVRSQQEISSKDSSIAQEFIDNARNLIDKFERLASAGDDVEESLPSKKKVRTDNDPKGQRPKAPGKDAQDATQNLSLRPSKRKHTEDPPQNTRIKSTNFKNLENGELFTIDSEPTPIDDLLSVPARPVKRVKGRLHTQSSSENVLGEITDELEDLSIPPSAKKPQSDHNIPPTPDHTDQPNGTARNEDSFLAKFNQKIIDRENKKKKKKDKKRKRDSQASVASNDGPEQSQGAQRAKKKLKRVKGNKSADTAEARTLNDGQKRAGPAQDAQRKRTRRENFGNKETM